MCPFSSGVSQVVEYHNTINTDLFEWARGVVEPKSTVGCMQDVWFKAAVANQLTCGCCIFLCVLLVLLCEGRVREMVELLQVVAMDMNKETWRPTHMARMASYRPMRRVATRCTRLMLPVT